ncbi:MAG: hypothetical protein ACI906_003422, partial [Candidatus Latescibacterota bacterium]
MIERSVWVGWLPLVFVFAPLDLLRADPLWPFDRLPLDSLRTSNKKVFAHYLSPVSMPKWAIVKFSASCGARLDRRMPLGHGCTGEWTGDRDLYIA